MRCIRLLRDDRGALSTETAVITFLLVGMAMLIVGFISGYAESIVTNLPTP